MPVMCVLVSSEFSNGAVDVDPSLAKRKDSSQSSVGTYL